MALLWPEKYFNLSSFCATAQAVGSCERRDGNEELEVGCYMPTITDKTDKRCLPHPGGSERRNVAIQTINIEVDERGYIYVADRPNTGVHILELKGDAR